MQFSGNAAEQSKTLVFSLPGGGSSNTEVNPANIGFIDPALLQRLQLVLDAFGNEVWTDEIGPVSGSAVVSHVYAGPALEPGMFYQFRATSFREKTGTWTAISTTEDLKGVFYYLEQ